MWGYRELAKLGGGSWGLTQGTERSLEPDYMEGEEEARTGGRRPFVKVLGFDFIPRTLKTACHSCQDPSNTMLTSTLSLK